MNDIQKLTKQINENNKALVKLWNMEKINCQRCNEAYWKSQFTFANYCPSCRNKNEADLDWNNSEGDRYHEWE